MSKLQNISALIEILGLDDGIEIEKSVRFYLPRMASAETKFKTFVSINAITLEKI